MNANDFGRFAESIRGESNYERLFGTPERAARTLIQTSIACQDFYKRCTECPFYDTSICPNNFEEEDYDALLEWLKEGDA